VDVREQLRRYLEQRRDLGETELVLDSLSVEEALALLGAKHGMKQGAARPPADDARGTAHAASDAPSSTADWRAAIRAAGGAPESAGKTPRVEERAETMPQSAASGASPLEDVPTGLVVGGASRALFGDPAAKLDTIEEIARVVAECRRCPLYATATNPVPGDGNPDADFMCVGEAPGANEDEQGKPFVGQAGQLLTKILAAIDLKREDVFIANVLKHRPPGNRNPLPDEVIACSPYLVRQIELIRPKVILALGTFAAQTLLETKLTIGKLRGQVHRYYGVPLIVTYHPAALLRNPAWKRPTWEDVQLARRILDRARPSGA